MWRSECGLNAVKLWQVSLIALVWSRRDTQMTTPSKGKDLQ